MTGKPRPYPHSMIYALGARCLYILCLVFLAQRKSSEVQASDEEEGGTHTSLDEIHRRILLVDDDDKFRESMSVLIKDAFGATVDDVASGLEALRVVEAANDPYDVILLDVKMPDFDGIETCTELKKRNCSSKIVMMSAIVDSKAVEALDVVFLPKPLKLEDLKKAIGSIGDGGL